MIRGVRPPFCISDPNARFLVKILPFRQLRKPRSLESQCFPRIIKPPADQSCLYKQAVYAVSKLPWRVRCTPSYQEYGSAELSDAIRWDALESNRLFIVSKGSAMSLANKLNLHQSRITYAVGEDFDHSLAKSVVPALRAHSRASAWGVRLWYRNKCILTLESPAGREGLLPTAGVARRPWYHGR